VVERIFVTLLILQESNGTIGIVLCPIVGTILLLNGYTVVGLFGLG
jgi:hypothetical protein